jgi:hypothetical protein
MIDDRTVNRLLDHIACRVAEKLPCFFNAWEVSGGIQLLTPLVARARYGENLKTPPVTSRSQSSTLSFFYPALSNR